MESLSKVLKVVGEAVSRRANVQSVVGSPIVIGDRTYLPVAKIQYGFGGGDNNGVTGGGGGMEAIPLGLIEIGPAVVAFHPIPAVGEFQGPPEVSPVAPGILQLDSGPELPRCWLLVHGEEAAVVNAPPRAAIANVLLEQVARMQGARVRYLLLTCCDYHHAGGLSDLARVFPEARLVAHRSVEHNPGFPPKPGPHDAESWRLHLPGQVEVHGFDRQVWTDELDGEPLFALYAPRHSWTDGMVMFRGALLVGQPGPGQVPTEVALRVRRDLREILTGPYQVTATLHADGQVIPGLDLTLFD